jgi:hypothetical protein
MSVTLRRQDTLMVFEKNVRKKIFGEKREEVIGNWIQLRNEELPTLYFSPDIVD